MSDVGPADQAEAATPHPELRGWLDCSGYESGYGFTKYGHVQVRIRFPIWRVLLMTTAEGGVLSQVLKDSRYPSVISFDLHGGPRFANCDTSHEPVLLPITNLCVQLRMA